jgi:hypothetical protein
MSLAWICTLAAVNAGGMSLTGAAAAARCESDGCGVVSGGRVATGTEEAVL